MPGGAALRRWEGGVKRRMDRLGDDEAHDPPPLLAASDPDAVTVSSSAAPVKRPHGKALAGL
jgi:hypothetical protein